MQRNNGKKWDELRPVFERGPMCLNGHGVPHVDEAQMDKLVLLKFKVQKEE